MKVLLVSSAGGHYQELLKLGLAHDQDNLVITEKQKNRRYPTNTKFLKYGSRNNKFSYPFIFLYNAILSLKYILSYKPDVIISTGAHSCVSFFYLAKLLGIKSIYIESFAKVNYPSLTYKLIKKCASVIIVQHQELLAVYPNSIYIGGLY